MKIKNKIKKIKCIVFDVDGVLVERGTKIKSAKNKLELQIKKIAPKQIKQIRQLSEKTHININSGRGLYYLLEMFREVLPYVSITYENGSATWYKGKIYQHINSYGQLIELQHDLSRIRDDKIRGFEPKEFIITIHCQDRVNEIEKAVRQYPRLYCIWNGEAYDVVIKDKQTKANGVKHLIKLLNLKKENVMAVGDNYNDREMLAEAGLKVSTDKSRLKGDIYIPLNGKKLPAEKLIEDILNE